MQGKKIFKTDKISQNVPVNCIIMNYNCNIWGMKKTVFNNKFFSGAVSLLLAYSMIILLILNCFTCML